MPTPSSRKSTFAERRRRRLRKVPPPPLIAEAEEDAYHLVTRFGRMLERRTQEQAERRRSRVAGPAEVEEAWDGLMRPGRRPPLWRVFAQEFCVLIAGGCLSAAGGAIWFTERGGALPAATLTLAAVGFAVAGGVLRARE